MEFINTLSPIHKIQARKFFKWNCSILILLSIFNLILLDQKQWYFQGQDSYQWKGDLFRIMKSQGFFDQNSYSQIAEDYCEAADNEFDSSKQNSGENQSLLYYQLGTVCQQFSQIRDSGIVYTSFSSGAAFLAITITISLFRFAPKSLKFCIWQLIGIFCFRLISFSAMAGNAVLVFDGDCKQVYEQNHYKIQRKSICSGGVPAAALAIFLVSSIHTIFLGIQIHLIIKRYVHPPIQENQQGFGQVRQYPYPNANILQLYPSPQVQNIEMNRLNQMQQRAGQPIQPGFQPVGYPQAIVPQNPMQGQFGVGQTQIGAYPQNYPAYPYPGQVVYYPPVLQANQNELPQYGNQEFLYPAQESKQKPMSDKKKKKTSSPSENSKQTANRDKKKSSSSSDN